MQILALLILLAVFKVVSYILFKNQLKMLRKSNYLALCVHCRYVA